MTASEQQWREDCGDRRRNNGVVVGLRALGLAVAAAAGSSPSAAATAPVAAFGVMPTSTPRPMENLVLGTVALPRVPCGSDRLLDDAYSVGFRRFDLARTYGAGQSERLFGEWLDKSGVDREGLRLVTKGGMGEDKYGNPGKAGRCFINSLFAPGSVV